MFLNVQKLEKRVFASTDIIAIRCFQKYCECGPATSLWMKITKLWSDLRYFVVVIFKQLVFFLC
jgi:hypothetical protein